ncbi:hypothetical protein DSM104299_04753 [Baekduia alba]|nr:hypothetical protein DSM104299_04753 [Baekduia alba]
MSGGASQMRPLYLGSGASAVFGIYHPPPEAATGVPVLMCGPLGFDDVCSHATRRRWAEHLAAEGHPVLRIDLPGTGDSGGTPRDAGLVRTWVAGADAAARWLAHATATQDVAAIGVGVGGLLLRAAAAAGAPLRDLVLWGTPANGRKATRELRAFARLEKARLEDDVVPEGGLAVGGYLLTAETLGALAEVDPAALDAAPPGGARALLLGREDTAVDEALERALASAGYATTTAPGPGHAEMMDEPYLGKQPPAEVFARVDAWLADAVWAAVDGPVPDDGPGGYATLEQPAADGGAVRESPFTIEQPFGRLFGVLAEPASGRVHDHGLCLVLLNAGAQRHIGPNRMSVEIARRWAARGVPSLRFDLANVGESDPDGEPWDDVEGFYTEAYGAQVRSVLDALQAAGRGDRFVLMGLCSGGYWAFETCLTDDRAVSALMLNPGALVWDPVRLLAWQSRRFAKLRHTHVWLRLVRGEVPRRDLARAIRGVVGWPLATLRRLPARLLARFSRATPQDPADAAFDRLRDAGKRGLLIFGAGEQLRADYENTGLFARFARWPNVELHLFEGEGQAHELQPLLLQQRAHALADAAIEREVALAGPDTVVAARSAASG